MSLSTFLVIAALLGSALIGGVFFAFSSFIMPALARRPDAEGMAAMQSINVVVINRSFLGAFFGTGVLHALVAGTAVYDWGAPGSPFLVTGALGYLLGTIGVTMAGNVPLNDRLAQTDETAASAPQVWETYLERWTRLNSIRATAAMLAALSMGLALQQPG